MTRTAEHPHRHARPDTGPRPGGDRLPARHAAPEPSEGRTGRPRRTTSRLHVRLVRRGAVLMALAGAAYVAIEVASYSAAYPNGVSPLQFRMFVDNPAIRMMQGVPSALDTAGGFTVWDGGWIMQLILATWALLTASRLLRGEEELGRTDLLLAGPLRASAVTASALAVMAGAAVLIGAAVATTLAVAGTAVGGSLLFGAGLAGVAATFAGVAAVTSQLVEVRRRAAGLAAGVIALAYLLRMVGNSADDRAWVLWVTPLGWVDRMHPYGDADPWALLPVVLAPVLLAVLAVALQRRRDVGGALLAAEAGRAPRLRLLGGPTAFAWRSNRAVLVAWVAGLAVFAGVMGALVGTMIDWLEQDQEYQRIFAAMGLDAALTTLGFVAMIGQVFGVTVALQVVWRVGSARAEEESGRLEALLSRRVSRVRWLGGHVVLALLGGVLLLVLTGVAVWLGCLASGTDQVTWDAALKALLNTLPPVVLVGGLAVLTFGVLPRLTVAIPAAVAVVGYLVTILGPPLHWPAWVLDLSPFTHLAWVPAVPWAATSGVVMLLVGVVLTVVGLVAFRRRDLVGD